MAAHRTRPPAYAPDLHSLLISAEACEASGDHSRAAEVLAEARAELFVQAEKISDPAIRWGFLEDIPEHARLLSREREWLSVERISGAE